MVTVYQLDCCCGCCWLLAELISDDNRKISVITRTLLCVFASCERHSELTEQVYISLRPIPREYFSSVDMSINWPSIRNGQSKVLDT